jgi:hypothetical protein
MKARRTDDGDVKPAPTGTVSGAEAERRRLAVNADRAAYQQQGLRPAGGERGAGTPADSTSRSFGAARPAIRAAGK